MIVTKVALSDITNDNPPLSSDAALVLASHTVGGTAKLIWCNWLAADECWQDKIKLKALAKHYKLDEPLDSSGLKFVPLEQLDANDSEQQLLLTAVAQMQEYLQGRRQDFDLPLDVSLGTPFQQQVWQALLDINHGETISYKTLAECVNNPKGYRAVANANGKNPLSIIIPCHRVIASDGKLGGYTGGLDKKEHLLALECIKVNP
ncbi:methylated-DNA--[protein]-cysteine S-methyltransferase [Psychrobacter frigidicola]|uniref:Methylated-DNA--protein-cysteine methyltransferase n=1 Tax=Psychrobacter frigidicola TaxID=45611 RepID=A0A5C7AAX3_9GAMM|nr:methylated-DNA--[protein]-cysteine S-methyltransferase [Psychrobacter frigidicola]TXD98003.1 methylated-DNA--[protein]-cysteine S-methyltransferase [Psychrobacter frigidicola]